MKQAKIGSLASKAARIFALPVCLVLAWHAFSLAGWVDKLFLPGPGEVLAALLNLFSTSEIWPHLWATLMRMFSGFFVALVIAVPAGIVLGHIKKVYLYCEFLIDFARSIPATAIFPLFMIIFGVGDEAKIAIVAFSCGFVILINTIYGVWNAPKTRIVMAKTLRASGSQILTKIVFFDALPDIFAGLRNAVSIALILTVVCEMFIGTNSGLGFLVFNAKTSYDTPKLYAVIGLLGGIGYFINKGLLRVEGKVIPWSR